MLFRRILARSRAKTTPSILRREASSMRLLRTTDAVQVTSTGSNFIKAGGFKAKAHTGLPFDYLPDTLAQWNVVFTCGFQDPVSTTNIQAFSTDYRDFAKRGTQIIALVPNLPVKLVAKWVKDIEQLTAEPEDIDDDEFTGEAGAPAQQEGDLIEFPVIADTSGQCLAKFHPGLKYYEDIHRVFIVSPQNLIMSSQALPKEIGFNTSEILRLVEAFQAAADHEVLIPANWKPGRDALLPEGVDTLEATSKRGPENIWEVNPYLRYVRIDGAIDNSSSVIGYQNMQRELMDSFAAFKAEKARKEGRDGGEDTEEKS